MDPRLIPLNGILALLREDGGWPDPLATQGFRIHLVEATVFSEPANIKADAIMYRRSPDLIVLCEGKGGKNVQPKQARSYLNAELDGLRASGTLPRELNDSQDVAVAAMFVGLEELRSDLVASLAQFDLHAPLLTVGATRVRLTGSSLDGLEDFDIKHTAGLPPARFAVDADSPEEEIRELVVQELVAAQARKDEVVSISALAAALLADWPILGREGQREFRTRLEDVVLRLTRSELRSQFEFERSERIEPRVVIVRTPASADARGATQQWQAQARRVGRVLGRKRTPPSEGQTALSIEDLAEGRRAPDA